MLAATQQVEGMYIKKQKPKRHRPWWSEQHVNDVILSCSRVTFNVVFHYFRNISQKRGGYDVKARLWEYSCEGVTDSLPPCSNESWEWRPRQAALRRDASVCSKHTPVNTVSTLIKLQLHHDIFSVPYVQCRKCEGSRWGKQCDSFLQCEASVREPDIKWLEAIWNALVVLLISQRCRRPHKKKVCKKTHQSLCRRAPAETSE